MKLNRTIVSAGLAFILAGGGAFAKEKDIVDTAVAAGSFKTLVAALKAAGLVETLKGDGPFTVFAPTDEAFAKLPKGKVESLLKAENKDKLTDILTYHVVSGKVPAKVAVTLKSATALNMQDIKVKNRKEGLFLNKSKVIKTDIMSSNGIIHVIDSVLMPPSKAKKESAALNRGDAMKLLHATIEKGVPLYNGGHHRACASVYESTARALAAMPSAAVSKRERRMLVSALAEAEKSHCMTTNAWTYRGVFDRMLLATH